MERLLELEKYKRTLDDAGTSSDILITMKIATIEQTLNYLMEYEQGKLHEEFNRERERIHYGRK
ncbi:hypothetical protein [Saccharococcus thermophilus]|uniref:Uncharacterized protein n=1 Tax=Saccharococcus thermophilus TaxID=29396 RepID=A0A846MF58_9BACL|nr:hypothetical protein [Saccharococcus thermophilus]